MSTRNPESDRAAVPAKMIGMLRVGRIKTTSSTPKLGFRRDLEMSGSKRRMMLSLPIEPLHMIDSAEEKVVKRSEKVGMSGVRIEVGIEIGDVVKGRDQGRVTVDLTEIGVTGERKIDHSTGSGPGGEGTIGEMTGGEKGTMVEMKRRMRQERKVRKTRKK